VPELLALVEPHTAGDPMSQTKWLNCRLRDIQNKLTAAGHPVSLPVISRLLKSHEYRLQQNVKQHEGTAHPERGRQFAYIHAQREQHQQAGQPTLSVDTKKKELGGISRMAGGFGVGRLKR
jgi:hypothetical protein